MICVSLAEPDLHALVDALHDLTFAEIRLDRTALSDDDIRVLFSQPATLIATCRPGTLPADRRMHCLATAIEAGANYVDLELETVDLDRTALLKRARLSGTKVIVSWHHSQVTPERNVLKNLVDRCFDSGADIAKIVCRTKTSAENARLLSLYDDERPIIAFGIGKNALFTRVAELSLGAPFIYAARAAGKEVEEDQPPRDVLLKILESIHCV